MRTKLEHISPLILRVPSFHIPVLAIFLLFISPFYLKAQKGEGEDYYEKVDELVLNDGSVLKGKILELGADSLEIELSSGQQLRFARSGIREIRFDVSPASEDPADPGPDREEELRADEEEEREPRYATGYQNAFMHGWFMNAGDQRVNLSFLGNPWVGSLHSYRFSPHFLAGLLLNFHFSLGSTFYSYSAGINDISLYLEGDLLERSKVTPFWYLQCGYPHSLNDALFRAGVSTEGVSAIGGVGAKLHYKNTRAVALSLGYQFMRTKRDMSQYQGGFTRHDVVKGLALRIGLYF